MSKKQYPLLEHGKYYIILSPVEKNDSEFTLAAYDTTGMSIDNIDELPAVAIVHEGITAIIDSDIGLLYQKGLAALERKRKIKFEDNVINVNFGDKK